MASMGLENLNWDFVGVDEPPAAGAFPKSSSFTANRAAGSDFVPGGFGASIIARTEPDVVFAAGEGARPYPVDALGPLAPVVRLVARRTQAPVAIAAGSALGVTSLAVQGHADVQTMAGSAPTSLFVLTVAKSGERKSACDKMLSTAISQHEREADSKFRKALTSFLAHEAAYQQVQNRAKAAIRAGDAGVEAMESVGPAPRKPLLPDRVATEPTFEGLTKLFAEGNPSLAVLSDEGGQFLGGHAMNTENRQKTLTAFSKLWDGDAIKRTRAGDGSITLRGRRLSLHLMVQPVVASELLADTLAIGQGFLPRLLVCQPESNIGFRQVDVSGAGDELSFDDRHTLDLFNHRLLTILGQHMPTFDGEEGRQGQELDLRTLPLSREARKALGEFAATIELAQQPGECLSELTGTASKIAEQACRLAGVMTLFSDLNANEVQAATMHDAIALASWYLNEALRLTGAAAISREEQELDGLRRWICTRWPDVARNNGCDSQTLIPAYVTQYGPPGMRSTAKTKAALAELARLGWLLKLDPNSVVDGKPRRLAYRIADR